MSYSAYQVAEWWWLLSGLLPPCEEEAKIGPSHLILQQSVAALKQKSSKATKWKQQKRFLKR